MLKNTKFPLHSKMKVHFVLLVLTISSMVMCMCNRQTSRKILLGAAKLAAVVFWSPVCFAMDLPRAAIEARLDAIQNLTVTFHERTDFDTDPALEKDLPPMVMRVESKRTESGGGRFSFRDGKACVEEYLDNQTQRYWLDKGMFIVKHQLLVFPDNGRQEELNEEDNAKGTTAVAGGIDNFKDFPEELTIDIAMGLRLYGDARWLTKDRIETATEAVSVDANVVTLRINGDRECVHELRFDRKLLYALVYYRCTFSNGSFNYMTNSDFRRYGSVFLPLKVVRGSQYIDSAQKLRDPIVYTLAIDKYVMNDPGNTSNRFTMIWPGGLRIYDSRIKEVVDVGPTSRPLSDDDIREAIADRERAKREYEQRAQQRINQALGQRSPVPSVGAGTQP